MRSIACFIVSTVQFAPTSIVKIWPCSGRTCTCSGEPAGDGACAVGVAAAAAVSQWGPGGCVAVLDGGDSEADARPAVALSCVKTEPDWLRVCGQDKAALAAVSRELQRRAASSPPA